MLMNTAKGYSALFPSVSQPIQGQGNMRSLSPGRISQFSVRLPVPRLCSYSQCIICSGFTPLLSTEQGLLHLGHNQALQIQVLCTVSFTTKFTFFLGVVDSRLFPHLTHRTPFFVPGLSSSHDLLGSLSGNITSGALLSVFVFLSRLRSVWICCEVEYSLAWHLASYHRPLWARRCLR